MTVGTVTAPGFTSHILCQSTARIDMSTLLILMVTGALSATALAAAPPVDADNKQLNEGAIANVFTIQRHADAGSAGSTQAERAAAAAFTGPGAQAIASNRALAISVLEAITMWYRNPRDLVTVQDCQYTKMGVWSENSVDRTVLVATYGRPT